MIEYRGFYIEFNIYGSDEYSVQYCGDDLVFDSDQEAKNFIDTIA